MSPELVIVGAGPAGVSAALWARSRNLDALVLEAAAGPGGQLHRVSFTPRDLPGVRDSPGTALAEVYAEQLREASIPVRYGVTATAIESTRGAAGSPVIVDGDGVRHVAAAALIATGARRRRLEVPGERELEDRGVSYSATRDREQLRGRRVAVVGGGDAAYENALILADADCDVTLIVRDTPRARREFRERVAAVPRIRVLEHTRVRAIEGAGAVTAMALDGGAGATRIAVEGVVIKAGEVPNTEWCRGGVDLDVAGFIRVDARYRTSRAGVWAAGDVMGPALPAIAVAIGSAALAVADIRAELKGD